MKTFASAVVAFLIITSHTIAGPINDAARNGDVAGLQAALNGGADPNEPDSMASPLHWAAMRGHTDAVRLLAEKGADLNARAKRHARHSSACCSRLRANRRPSGLDRRRR